MADNAFLRLFTSKKVSSPTKTLGVTGTPLWNGYIQTKEKDPLLADARTRYITYSEIIANTTIVAAGIRYFLNLVGKSRWKAVAADDTPQAIEIAEAVDHIIHNMATPWHRVVRRAAMYKFYGFSVQEWTASRRIDGKTGFKDISPRAQYTIERWDCNDDGEVFGMWQVAPMTGDEIWLPRDKVVYLVDDSLQDSPEGFGLLRHLYETNKRLKRFEELEGFGFETDLRGIPVGRAPISELQALVEKGTLDATERDSILLPLKNFIENHIKGPKLGMILDSSVYESQDDAASPSPNPLWDLSLLQSPGSGTSLPEVAQAIIRCQREMARVLGVEQLLLGEGKGAFSLSKDKTQAFALTIDSALTELTEQFKFDIVDVLMRLNGWPEELRPELQTESMRFQDIETVTEALAALARAGAVMAPEDPAINEVRDMIGLSNAIILPLEEEMQPTPEDTLDGVPS